MTASAKKEDAESVIRPIWTWPDINVYGAASPDGRYFPFSNAGLAIREIATARQRNLANRTLEDNGSVVWSKWSRDSKSVAYTWEKPNGESELRAVSLDGLPPRIVFKGKKGEWITPADWSPDGKYMAFFSLRSWQRRYMNPICIYAIPHCEQYCTDILFAVPL